MTEEELNSYHCLKSENKLLIKHNKDLISEVEYLKGLVDKYSKKVAEQKKNFEYRSKKTPSEEKLQKWVNKLREKVRAQKLAITKLNTKIDKLKIELALWQN
jgi:predicted RNase H-like nuclease (RuvC/YqgF family)